MKTVMSCKNKTDPGEKEQHLLAVQRTKVMGKQLSSVCKSTNLTTEDTTSCSNFCVLNGPTAQK